MTFFLRTGIVAILLCAWSAESAAAQQDADAYFHEAARHYINGNLPAARRAVTQGLSAAPSDPRLRALREKLRQRRRRAGAADSSRRSSRPQQAGQQGGGSGRPSPSTSGERPRPAPAARDSSTAESAPPPRPSSGRNRQDGTDGVEQGAKGSAADEAAPSRARRPLSRAQAERLLRALETQERRLLQTLRRPAREAPTVEKDW